MKYPENYIEKYTKKIIVLTTLKHKANWTN